MLPVLCFLLKEVWTHVWFRGTGKHLQHCYAHLQSVFCKRKDKVKACVLCVVRVILHPFSFYKLQDCTFAWSTWNRKDLLV